MGHSAHKREILLQRVLQYKDIALSDTESVFHDAHEIEHEGEHLVAIGGTSERQVDGSHLGQRIFVVGLRLVAR